MRNQLRANETVDAKKTAMGRKEALDLSSKADEIYTIKTGKVLHLDLKKDKPTADTIIARMLGPTGNLRAPTIRHGRTLLVGFDEDTYKRVLIGIF